MTHDSKAPATTTSGTFLVTLRDDPSAAWTRIALCADHATQKVRADNPDLHHLGLKAFQSVRIV